MFEAQDQASSPGQGSQPDVSGPGQSNPQPAPSTPTQPGGEPQKHPNDPIKIDPNAPVKNPSPEEEKRQGGGSGSKAAGASASEYQPNFKYKVDREEKEMPDWVRPFITPENEEKFRDLFHRGHGIESVKERLVKEREEFSQVKGRYETLQGDLKNLSKFLNNKDLGSFFEAIKVPDEMIFDYVLKKLKMQELPPEQRAVYEQQDQLRKQNYLLEQQHQQLRQRYETEVTQARESALNQALMRPEVTTVVQSFDQRFGKPGAFREEVIKRGILYEQMYGRDITPEQAVSEVLQMLGHQMQAGSNQSQMFQAQQNGQTGLTPNPQEGRPPVIPNVGGRAASPMKRVPQDLKEIKQLVQTMAS